MRRAFVIIGLILLAALSVRAQAQPQLDMFGGEVGVVCPVTGSWLNTTVTSGAITGSTTPQNITLASLVSSISTATTAASVNGSNVATLTFASDPNAGVGRSINVSGFTGSDTYFNGNFTVTVSSTAAPWTVSYSLTHAAASATSNGALALNLMAGDWATIGHGAAPVQVTGEAGGTVASGTVSYPHTFTFGDVLPGTVVVKVNGVIVAEDKGPLGALTQNQHGMLVDYGLITTGTSAGAMQPITGGVAGSGGTALTAYTNMLSVQDADPTPSSVHSAVQEFANTVFQSAFSTAHNGQVITYDYQYSPAEDFIVPSLTGNQINGAVLLNNHGASAAITTGLDYIASPSITIAGVSAPTDVQCDALGFGKRELAMYSVGFDNSDGSGDGHSSNVFKTTVSLVDGVNTGISDRSSHTITPASMTGICNGCFITVDQGTSSEESVQANCSPCTTSFTASFQVNHSAGFRLEGYNQWAVVLGAITNPSQYTGNPTGGSTTGKFFGNTDIYGPLTNIELKGWNYNTIQFFGLNKADPLYIENAAAPYAIAYPTADNSQPEKMPAMQTIDTSFRAQSNSGGYAGTSGCGGTGDLKVKNILTTFNGVTSGAAPGNLYPAGLADFYDPNMYAWLCGQLKAGVGSMTGGGHENPWYINQEDEGDYIKIWGVSRRTGFTSFDGVYEDMGSREVLFLSPYLSISDLGSCSSSPTSASSGCVVFLNNVNNTKAAQAAALHLEYPDSGSEPACAGANHGIAALNTCWGITSGGYDSFGSDSTPVTGESIATTANSTLTVSTDSCAAPAAPPAAPTLTQGTSGTLTAGLAYSVAVGYVSSTGGETALSSVTTLTLGAGKNSITVTSPGAETGMTGYNVYVISCTAPGPCANVTSPSVNDAYNDVNSGEATPIALGTNKIIATPGVTYGHPPYADSTSVATAALTSGVTANVGDGFVISGTARGSGLFNSGSTPWLSNAIGASSVSFSWPVTGNDSGNGRGSAAISCPSGITSASDTGSVTDTSYDHTFAHIPDRETIQIFVNGNLIAGDLPGGGKSTAYLPTGTITGSSSSIAAAPINYSAKTGAITFSSIPVGGDFPITTNYRYGGWGSGHGLLDEDGTCPAITAPSCATVFGTDSQNITNDGNANFQADMLALLGQMASYFSTEEAAQFHAIMPHTLIVSDYAVGNHRAPSDPVVLQNYCPNVDILGAGDMPTNITNSGGFGPQGISPFQYMAHYCTKPVVYWTGSSAPADSQMSQQGCGPNGIDATQAARAAYYVSQILGYDTVMTATSSRNALGLNTWSMVDAYSECGSSNDGGNWGSKDENDNPYDAVHNTTTAGFELIGNNALPTTPETANYGNFIGPVTAQMLTTQINLVGGTQQIAPATGLFGTIHSLGGIHEEKDYGIPTSSSALRHPER